jgi:ATP-dependent helicase HrpB
MIPLPIDSHLPKIILTLRSCGSLVLTAPPGAGKTTRIPRALCDNGFADRGEILILEPRRLATRLAASRVAQEFGEKLGETVGYSIRYENVSGPKTRIRFLTEAILARRIIHDPNLNGVSTVILDEFHERSLATDLALAFLKQLQRRKPDLKILVMSATMDAQPVASFLANASVLAVEGSPFSLDIEYDLKPSDRPLQEKVAAAVTRLIRTPINGDILVFLPGSAEIRRAAEALKPASEQSGILLLPLHGDLPAAAQKRAIEPAEQAKVILATNVAETSITIPGIAAVVDSGLARVAGHSAWSGFPTLATAKISKSSAMQRAGRAGRTQSGKVIRLYTRHDFDSRQEQDVPEIKRADLTETVLMLHGAGVKDAGRFEWFEPPADSALRAAEGLLVKLGAVNENGVISDIGARMLQLPVHPRLARLIIEGEKLQVAEDSTLLAALISERDIRLDVRADFGILRSKTREHASGPSDLLELLDCFREAEGVSFGSNQMRALGLDARAIQAVGRSLYQLRRILSGGRQNKTRLPDGKQKEEALLIATLAAFPDRVAKRRKTGSRELLLAGGGSAVLSQASIVHKPQFVVAVDVEERKESVPTKISGVLIRLASAIEPEWLAGLFPESISQKIDLIWNERAGRVEEMRQTSYGEISLEETVKTAHPSEEASRLLASAVLARPSLPFHDISELPALQARLGLISKTFPEANLSEIGDSKIRESVEQLCRQRRSLEELESLSILDILMDGLSDRQRALIRSEAPERIKLKSGRAVKIHYEAAKSPWIESRLQDFFGTFSTPAICAGRVPLTIHLLAPNQRAVQVTQDLAGFWKNHYPAVRRELQRRYPRHAWPEPDSLRKK